MSQPVRRFAETLRFRSSWWHRVQGHRYFPAAVAVAIVLAACSLHIWQRVRVMSLVGEVAVLEERNDELTDATAKLNAEIAQLSMAHRIERFALDSLGLVPLEAHQVSMLIPAGEEPPEPDQLSQVLRAIDRVTDHMPIVTASEATAREAKTVRFPKAREEDGQ